MEEKDKSEYGKDFRYIVRIANTDLDGKKKILDALRKIKGVSFMFSNLLCQLAGISKDKKTGDLTDDELKKINDVIRDPQSFKAPVWMFNRRKDYETGSNRHLVSVDVAFSVDNDMKTMKRIKSYKGLRHQWGLTVRGQRTKSHFRKNKGKVHLGVVKKKIVSAPEEEKKKGGKREKK